MAVQRERPYCRFNFLVDPGLMTWRFRNARPVSLAYSPLLAMEAGVLMETIAIAFNGIEME